MRCSMPCWREGRPTSWLPPYDLGPHAELTSALDPDLTVGGSLLDDEGEPARFPQPVTGQGAK